MKPNKTYIIRNKETKELFHAQSGKTSWKMPGHAKNAFNQSMRGRTVKRYGLEMIDDPKSWDTAHQRAPKFDEQEVFEIVELKPESEDTLSKAVKLLKYCLGRCDYDTNKMIESFLSGVEEC